MTDFTCTGTKSCSHNATCHVMIMSAVMSQNVFMHSVFAGLFFIWMQKIKSLHDMIQIVTIRDSDGKIPHGIKMFPNLPGASCSILHGVVNSRLAIFIAFTPNRSTK